MTALRELRRAVNLSQHAFAAILSVPANTYRMWDSGLRPVPVAISHRAQRAATAHARSAELLSLDQLASELGVHQRTLRDAARAGRLRVTFSVKSVFGRPIRLATRAAGQAFMQTRYGHYGRRVPIAAPLLTVPHDYDVRLKALRRRLRLTQNDLARRIGAANKAVVYQWESRQRTPSPVFWARIEALRGATSAARHAPMSSKGFVTGISDPEAMDSARGEW